MMELLDWSYTKKCNVQAIFSPFSHSRVIFRQIKDYYFVYTVHWSPQDPVVARQDLETMEILLNRELGTEKAYQKRLALNKLWRERSECDGRPS